jgi:hypothetical protein
MPQRVALLARRPRPSPKPQLRFTTYLPLQRGSGKRQVPPEQGRGRPPPRPDLNRWRPRLELSPLTHSLPHGVCTLAS